MKPAPWSHTALSDFQNCPKQFYEKRVIKRVKEVPSEQMIWGQKVHKCFEDRMAYGVVLPDVLEEHEAYLGALDKAHRGRMQTERKIALNTKLQPCGYFDKDVFYRGVIDLSIRLAPDHMQVVDYKTGKQHSDFQQLKLFAVHIFAEYPEIEAVDVNYYWLNTKRSTGEQYVRADVPHIWRDFTPDLKQYAYAFQNNLFPPKQSGLCNGWCPVTNCEFWKPKRTR